MRSRGAEYTAGHPRADARLSKSRNNLRRYGHAVFRSQRSRRIVHMANLRLPQIHCSLRTKGQNRSSQPPATDTVLDAEVFLYRRKFVASHRQVTGRPVENEIQEERFRRSKRTDNVILIA